MEERSHKISVASSFKSACWFSTGYHNLDAFALLTPALDFHALRGTYDTNLAIAGVSDAVRMKLMRHKSPRLTLETYTDSEKVPVEASLAKLPEFNFGANGNEHTGKDTGILVQGGQSVSKPVTTASVLTCEKNPAFIGESHGLSPFVTFGHGKSNGGEGGIRTPAAPQENIHEYTGKDTAISVVPGHDLSRVVTSWDKLPPPLKAAILAIVDTAGK